MESLSIDAIRKKFGTAGTTDYDMAYGRRGAVTDDTHMTLFTAEGLVTTLQAASRRSMLTLEELHCTFVFLCRGSATKSSEVAAAAGSWIRFS